MWIYLEDINLEKSLTSVWIGSAREGGVHITIESGALNEAPYSFNARFSNENGTNPEELIGAADAGCFNMALAVAVSEAGYSIDAVNLNLTAHVPGISTENFDKTVARAKANCPVSKVLNATISLDVTIAWASFCDNHMTLIKIGVIIGSLRKGFYNRRLAMGLQKLALSKF